MMVVNSNEVSQIKGLGIGGSSIHMFDKNISQQSSLMQTNTNNPPPKNPQLATSTQEEQPNHQESSQS